MPGSDYILGGPVWWFVFGLYALVLGMAAYVSVDSWRAARAERLAALREPAWVYRVLQPAFLLIALAVWLPFVPRVLAAVPVGLMLFALVGQFAYLLRVVFPKPAPWRRNPRRGGDGSPRVAEPDARGRYRRRPDFLAILHTACRLLHGF